MFDFCVWLYTHLARGKWEERYTNVVLFSETLLCVRRHFDSVEYINDFNDDIMV